MLTRICLLSLLLPALAASARAETGNLDGSSKDVGNAEAARLYAEANDFVTNMSEGSYSYDYLQFYWKRAEANVDRIRLVYQDSPTASSLARGDLKLGPYELGYFKERVLYNLELKHVASFDDVNCAIFLYGRDEGRSDAKRDEALANILEVLARRQRWAEALRFPVLSAHRALLLHSIFRVAAFYGADDIVRKMVTDTTPSERHEAGFDPLLAEGMALQGKPRVELYKFVSDHPGEDVRTAALRGVVERQALIERAERRHVSFGESIQTEHLVVQHASLRDDVASVANHIYRGDLDSAKPLMTVYYASRGTAPDSAASLDAHIGYMDYLFDAGRMAAVSTYVRDNDLTGATRRACQLEVIELYAEAGQSSEAEDARRAFAADFTPGADDAGLAEFRGRMRSTEAPLVVREKTFADLPIADPCVMATAIMEWSLSPNRSQRGATAWDAVVMRFAGGFNDLPMPKSAAVGDAASTLKPY